MKKKDRWWNSLLIISITAAIGAGLTYWTSIYWLKLPDGEMLVSRTWLWMAIGAAYTAGWFVTRAVEDSFDMIFTRNPFNRTGDDVGKDEPKNPVWLNGLLWGMAYPAFFLLVAGVMALLLSIATFIYWVVAVAYA